MNSNGSSSIHSSRKILKSFKAKADASRSLSEKIADFMTASFGSIPFLFINLFWFLSWIVINLGLIPQVEPFDPFPFGLLTMIVSLEAIVLSTFVLISQNRAAKTEDLREELDVQIDVLTEQEMTKSLKLLILLLKKNNIPLTNDPELEEMLKPTNAQKIEKALEKEIS